MTPLECFFAHLGGCQGRLVKAHLIPKQRIRRELVPARYPAGSSARKRFRERVDGAVWDSRCWAWMCGGATGLGGHHGAFDAKQIELHRNDLPKGLEEFAVEYGLAWSLEADYGLPSNFSDGATDPC